MHKVSRCVAVLDGSIRSGFDNFIYKRKEEKTMNTATTSDLTLDKLKLSIAELKSLRTKSTWILSYKGHDVYKINGRKRKYWIVPESEIEKLKPANPVIPWMYGIDVYQLEDVANDVINDIETPSGQQEFADFFFKERLRPLVYEVLEKKQQEKNDE